MASPNRALALLLVGLVAGGAHAASPSFTLSAGSPSLGAFTAGDVLAPAAAPGAGLAAPVLGIPALAMGLLPGDVINGLSYGILPAGPAAGEHLTFSVDPMAVGLPFAPPPPNVSCEVPEAHADIFNSQPFGPALPSPNVAYLDGNGAAGPCGPGVVPGLGLVEPGADNVFNHEMCPPSFVFSGAVLTAPVFLTLGAGSPTLGVLGVGAGTILIVPPPAGPPVVFLPAAALGLAPGPPGCGAPVCDEIDALDALCRLVESGFGENVWSA